MSPRPPVTPNSTGNCFQMMVMPMAASMPLITEDGTMRREASRSQDAQQALEPPAMTTAVRKGPMPPSWLDFSQHHRRQASGRSADRQG